MLDETQTETVEAEIAPVVEETSVLNTEDALDAIPEPTDALDAEVVADEAPAEEVVKDEVETTETPVEVAEPVTFDTELEVTALIEQGKAEVEKYEMPQPVQAYIEALEAKAQLPQFAEAAVYGDAVKELLERQYRLDQIDEVNGVLRPRTDLFLEEYRDETKLAWLYYDLGSQPSQKYPGLYKSQESIADAVRIEGESVEKTLERYNDTITALKTGATIVPDTPAFVPINLQEAYARLPKETRDELSLLDMDEDYDRDIAVKQLAHLELIQRGINADKADAMRDTQAREYRQNELQTKINTTQVNFWDTFKEGFVEKLDAKTKFSDNPAIQKLQVSQNIAMLSNIFDSGRDGDATRTALQAAGIKFDSNAPIQFLKDVERASVALAHAQSLTDRDGNPLDKVAYNKAVNEFTSVGKKLIDFGGNIIDQQARLISTGKVEEIKEAVAKQKIEVKSRAVPKGTGTAAVKKDTGRPPENITYGSPDWDRWYARQTMAEREAQKVRAYQ